MMPNGLRPLLAAAFCILLAGYAAGRLDAATHRYMGLASALVALALGVIAGFLGVGVSTIRVTRDDDAPPNSP